MRKPFRVTVVAPLLAGDPRRVRRPPSRAPGRYGRPRRAARRHARWSFAARSAACIRGTLEPCVSASITGSRFASACITSAPRARRTTGPLGRCPARVIRIKPWRGDACSFRPGATRSIRLRVRLRTSGAGSVPGRSVALDVRRDRSGYDAQARGRGRHRPAGRGASDHRRCHVGEPGHGPWLRVRRRRPDRQAADGLGQRTKRHGRMGAQSIRRRHERERVSRRPIRRRHERRRHGWCGLLRLDREA